MNRPLIGLMLLLGVSALGADGGTQACRTPADCHGMLPRFAVQCPGGGFAAASWACEAGTCKIEHRCRPNAKPEPETFLCNGTVRCTSRQLCRVMIGGAVHRDGSHNVNATCAELPEACGERPTCACLGNGANYCHEDHGHLFQTFPLP